MAPRSIAMLVKVANELDIFDEVELQYLKNARDIEGYEFNILDYCDADSIRIKVKISVQDLQERNEDGFEIMLVIYEFGLNYNCNFTFSRRFIWLSSYGRKLNKTLCGDDDEDEEVSRRIEEDEEDDDDDDDEEPTSVIDL